MSEQQRYGLSTIEITDQEWTPLVAKMNCNSVCIMNNSGDAAVLLSTDITDESAQDEIAPLNQEIIMAPWQYAHYSNMQYRYPAGKTICWVRSKIGFNVVKLRQLL